MPSISLVLLLLLMAHVWVRPDIAAGVLSVKRLVDGFGASYMIHEYALSEVEDYQLVNVSTSCQCRRWCQVLIGCHSASAIVLAGGGVECRISHKPVDLQDIEDRPKLRRTEGAFHFLSADTNEGDNPDNTFYNYYWTEDKHSWDKPPLGCKLAILTSREEVMGLLQALPENTPYLVNLKRPEYEPAKWDPNGSPLLYDATDHGTSRLQDTVSERSNAYFHIKHDGNGDYQFISGKGRDEHRVLCQDTFNLVD